MIWKKGDLIMELYEVRDVIGEGGCGVVYEVYHRGWGELLAVKSPRAELLRYAGWLGSFQHECETWVNLSTHPNTVSCYYVRQLGGVPRVFLEYVDGSDLWHLIHRKGLYDDSQDETLRRILDIAIQFAWGLYHAHCAGVVHQDVKCSNVIVSGDGCVKVTDFSLARVHAPDYTEVSSSESGNAPHARGPKGGTLVYSSPDLERFGDVTYKTDVWSWAVSIMEMFAGEIFWANGTEANSALEDLIQNGSRYKTLPKMPNTVASLLQTCLRIEPEERPASMLDISEVLIGAYEEVVGEPYPRNYPQITATSGEALNNRAISFLDIGKDQRAVELWNEALAMTPDHQASMNNMALYRWHKGMDSYGETRGKLWDACQKQTANWLDALFLARFYIEAGNCHGALEVLEAIRLGAHRREISFATALARYHLQNDTRLIKETIAHNRSIHAVALDDQGQRYVTGSSDGEICVWEAGSGSCISVLDGHCGVIRSLCLSKDGQTLISACADNTARVWGIHTGKCRQVLSGHTGEVLSIALNGEGFLAVTGSADGSVRVWDTKYGTCLRVLCGHEGMVRTVAISQNGKYALSGGDDGELRLWEVNTGNCVNVGEPHKRRIVSMAVSNDSPLVVTGGGRDVSLWDMERRTLIRAFRAHDSEVVFVCLGQGGRLVFSAHVDGKTRIWRASTGQCLRIIRARAPIACTEDGRMLVSQGERGIARFWALNPYPTRLAAPFHVCHIANEPVVDSKGQEYDEELSRSLSAECR
ncbi:MAG: serine/threonine protein kinase [Candidatus Hydrogenedentes bacterium]|nr:serine/threonine protein kinase [Candidatus Hydrogenedentota bacterium]